MCFSYNGAAQLYSPAFVQYQSTHRATDWYSHIIRTQKLKEMLHLAIRTRLKTQNYTHKVLPLNPILPNINIHILHTVLSTFSMVMDKENLFENHELLKLMIISVIIMVIKSNGDTARIN